MGEKEEGIVEVGSERLMVNAPFHVACRIDGSVYKESDGCGWLKGRVYGVIRYCLVQGILIHCNFRMMSYGVDQGKTHIAACASIIIVPRLGGWLLDSVGIVVENFSQGLIGRLNGQRADDRDV